MMRAEIAAMPDPWVLLKQITEGEWSGHITYRCPCCAFDSTRREATEEHVHGHIRRALVHDEPAQEQPVSLFGADGRPISKGA